MWIDKQPRHPSDEELVDCYFAESDLDYRESLAHIDNCASCTRRYADLTRDLETLGRLGAGEADAAFTPEMLAQQRQHVMRRLESHGRRAAIFPFPSRGSRSAGHRRAWRPAGWVAAAAAAGLAAGLALGLTVDRYTVNAPLSGPSQTVGSVAGPVETPLPATSFERLGPTEDELLDEIDSALVSLRVPELLPLDVLTPERVDISFRRR